MSQILGITTRTLSNWVKRKKTSDLAQSKRKERRPHKVNHEKLKTYLKKHPDAYLREIAEGIRAKLTAVFYACKRRGINLKKDIVLL
jgi:transposase